MAEKPEEKARAAIDPLLVKAGWTVQCLADANIHAAREGGALGVI